MANTKVIGDLIASGTITATNLADGAVTAAKLNTITTSSITEGTRLYYTDARVGSYLSANGYDTSTNIIAAITDSAPTTLDTLNELAAALGDDPNFATTITTSIATKLPLAGGTLTGNLGIGDTPSAMSAVSGIELVQGSQISSRILANVPQLYISSNVAGDSYAPTYKVNGYATQYRLQGYNGTHAWYTAPSGTFGNAVTFTQAMTLNASGNLSIGNTNDTYKLDVSGTGRFSGDVTIKNTSTSANLFIDAAAAGGSEAGLYFKNGGTNKWENYTANNDTALNWYSYANSTIVFKLASTGAATFSSTLTSTDHTIKNSANAETLDLFLSPSTLNGFIDYPSGRSLTIRNKGSLGGLTLASTGAATFSSDVLLNNGKFLQAARNTGGAIIDIIGIQSGSDVLQIKGGTSGGTNSINFYDTGGLISTFYAGRFGIGATSPAAKIETNSGGYILRGGWGFFTSYTPNGLYSSEAQPNFISTNAYTGTYSKFADQAGLLLGYWDNGAGLYSPAYGFEVKSTDGRPVTNNVVPALVIHDVDNNSTPWIVNNNGNTYISNPDPQIVLKRTDNAGSPSARITFATADETARWQIGTNQAVGLGFEINQGNASNNRLYIDTGGNVGIGTTNPSEKLDVAGVIRAKGLNNHETIITKQGSTGTFTFTQAELNGGLSDNVSYFIFVSVYRPTTDITLDVASLILHGVMPRGTGTTFTTISTLKGGGISTLTATNGASPGTNDLVVTTDSDVNLKCSVKVIAMGGTS